MDVKISTLYPMCFIDLFTSFVQDDLHVVCPRFVEHAYRNITNISYVFEDDEYYFEIFTFLQHAEACRVCFKVDIRREI